MDAECIVVDSSELNRTEIIDLTTGDEPQPLGTDAVTIDLNESNDFVEPLKTTPEVNDIFYVKKSFHKNSEWIRLVVTLIIPTLNTLGSTSDRYFVQDISSRNHIHKIVYGDQLAYATPGNFTYKIGSLVIGRSNESQSWYSGIIVELPSQLNGDRYLVFFTDGKVQYCPHSRIRMVYKTLRNVEEYFAGRLNVAFVLRYLREFAKWPKIRMTVGQSVYVEVSGSWGVGTVDALDGSLFRVKCSSDGSLEWIYSGSPRLSPVCEKLIAGPGPTISQLSSSEVEHAISLIQDLAAADETPIEAQPSTCILAIVQRTNRAVARNATSRPILRQLDTITECSEKRITKASVVIRYPPTMLTPRCIGPHECSADCVAWVEYSDQRTKGVSPLAIPSIFAFKRNENGRAIAYTAPCGKKLKSMEDIVAYLSKTLIPLNVDVFDFDRRNRAFREFLVNKKFVFVEDVSYGKELNPIACVNEHDEDVPEPFNYTNVWIPQKGVNVNLDPAFLICCDCTDNCQDKTKCRCSQLTIENFRPFNVDDDKRPISEIGYEFQRLNRRVTSGIFECNNQCKCSKVTCMNRVVQRPMRHKTQLFKTVRTGWGLRSVNDIPKGSFICTFVGNILTDRKAQMIGKVHGDDYMADLDHIEAMESSKPDFEAHAGDVTDEEDEPVPFKRKRSCSDARRPYPVPKSQPPKSLRELYGPGENSLYVIDGKFKSNIGRYLNHSCQPNSFVQNVYVDTHDLRFPYVALFALRNIPAGTEITWDYGYEVGTVANKVLHCRCGSTNCRKRLL